MSHPIIDTLSAKFKTGAWVSTLKTYRASIAFFAAIIVLILIDYAFRHSAGNFYERGLRAMTSSETDNAIKYFSRALRQNDKDPAARAALAWAYQAKGWGDEALKQYDLAAQAAQSTLVMSYYNSGVLQKAKGNIKDAEQFYLKSLAINPHHSATNFNMGHLYLEKGNFKSALHYFEKSAAADARSVNALYYSGYSNERLGNKSEARRRYHEVLKLDPSHAETKKRLLKL